MRRKSFKFKIIISTVIIVTALFVTLIFFLSLRFSALSSNLINEKLTANINSLKLFFDNAKAASRAAAVSIAQNYDVINAVKERNTEELIRLINPAPALYHINYCTISDNEGTVLARIHEPESFGDSILNQQNIKDALDGKTSTYFEEGTVVRVSVRTGSPVYDTDGVLIGIISAGIRFDTDDTINELEQLFKSEITIFLGDTRIATTITRDGQSIIGTTIDPQIAEIVIENKQEYTGDAKIFGEKYKTFYMPLLNAHNEAFATFFMGIPETEITASTSKSIRDGVILGISGLLVSIVLLFFIISSISEPIAKLSSNMDSIANGNLHTRINVKSEDEVGLLARSFQKVAGIIHKLIDDINLMITEHEKGNTDYYLNVDDFHGDYKTLAQSVLKFAAFGITDQLTGLPNRRNFDNRLNWQWKQAMKESTPISILVIDMDKLKNYNDSFGHQQGDMAVQTVAKTIKLSVRPSVDFVARWGDDEFFVLLPTADSGSAVSTAEKICAEIAKVLVPCAEINGLNVTVSIGVNTQVPSPGVSIDSFISIADKALYQAKSAGRNRVVFGGEG
jgi:diguanylate cyclase (GGDEF)-like protein